MRLVLSTVACLALGEGGSDATPRGLPARPVASWSVALQAISEHNWNPGMDASSPQQELAQKGPAGGTLSCSAGLHGSWPSGGHLLAGCGG